MGGRHIYCITLHFDFKRRTSLTEIKWVEEYPAELPTFSLESFYNKHLVPEVKQEIIKAVTEEAEQFLGMSMTYSLFEWVRESLDTLLANQPETLQTVCDDVEKLSVKETSEEPEEGKKK